jgi:hypothetical protein
MLIRREESLSLAGTELNSVATTDASNALRHNTTQQI